MDFIAMLPTLNAEDRQRSEVQLARAIRFRRQLNPRAAERLDAVASWPLEQVTETDQTAGWLAPALPEDFFEEFGSPIRPTVKRLRLLEYLSAAPRRIALGGDSPRTGDAVEILAVLANLVYAVATLHRYGLVYGDVSLASAVYSPADGRVLLLDGMGAASAVDPERSQRNSPYYLAPECQPAGDHKHARGNPHRQDFATDVYKLGLCIVRALSRGPGAMQVRMDDHLAAVLDEEAMATLDAALSDDPSVRPSARSLYSALTQCVGRMTEPPEITDFRAVSAAVPRGSDLLFTWDVRDATAAYLRGPHGFSMPVDPDWGYCAVPITHSGVFEFVATRRGATTIRPSGFVIAFDLPEFDLADVYEHIIDIPKLEPADLGPTLEDLPRRPAVEISSDFLPSVTLPPVATLTTAIATMAERISDSFSVASAISALTGVDAGALTLPTIDGLRFDVTEVGVDRAPSSAAARGTDAQRKEKSSA